MLFHLHYFIFLILFILLFIDFIKSELWNKKYLFNYLFLIQWQIYTHTHTTISLYSSQLVHRQEVGYISCSKCSTVQLKYSLKHIYEKLTGIYRLHITENTNRTFINKWKVFIFVFSTAMSSQLHGIWGVCVNPEWWLADMENMFVANILNRRALRIWDWWNPGLPISLF